MTPQLRLHGLLDGPPPAAPGVQHEPAPDGGYHLRVAGRRRVRVAPAGEGTGWQVRNLEAACASPVFGTRAPADALALRIARLP